MGKDVRYEGGKTTVSVYAEDAATDAAAVKAEIEAIAREALQAGNPTRFWAHRLTWIVIEGDSLVVEIEGNLVDHFVEKGYRIW